MSNQDQGPLTEALDRACFAYALVDCQDYVQEQLLYIIRILEKELEGK